MSKKPSVLTIALIGGVIVLIFGVITVTLTLNAEARFRDQALRSTSVIHTLDRILLGAVTAETSQRGYLIHGNNAYLEPYDSAIGELDRNIAEYERLLGDRATPSQLQQLERLKAIAVVKMNELDDVLDLYNSGQQEEAFDVFRSGAGLRAMDGIRNSVRILEEEEQEILESARAHAAEARLRTIMALAILTLLSLFAFALAYINHLRSDRLTAVEEQAAELTEARERADLLARELNHRVKNLFAIVQSIISATGRQESDPLVAASKARERVHALSLAHSLTSTLDAQKETTLERLLESIVRPQMTEPQSIFFDGPEVTVPAQYVTPFGMIFHELTTNAIKYGAWSSEEGAITVRWDIDDTEDGQRLNLQWIEACDASTPVSPPQREGFGSRMMSMSLIQLGGSQDRQWQPDGMRLTVVLPLDGNKTVSGRNKKG